MQQKSQEKSEVGREKIILFKNNFPMGKELNIFYIFY